MAEVKLTKVPPARQPTKCLTRTARTEPESLTCFPNCGEDRQLGRTNFHHIVPKVSRFYTDWKMFTWVSPPKEKPSSRNS